LKLAAISMSLCDHFKMCARAIHFCFSSFQPFAVDTARVMLKNLGASLCNAARLSAALSCAPLLKALLPDHKVAFWEEFKKRAEERISKEGDSEVLDAFHFFMSTFEFKARFRY
jgi:hypothetical protein